MTSKFPDWMPTWVGLGILFATIAVSVLWVVDPGGPDSMISRRSELRPEVVLDTSLSQLIIRAHGPAPSWRFSMDEARALQVSECRVIDCSVPDWRWVVFFPDTGHRPRLAQLSQHPDSTFLEFRYGTLPPGGELAHPPETLVAGHCYTVSIIVGKRAAKAALLLTDSGAFYAKYDVAPLTHAACRALAEAGTQVAPW